MEQECPKCGAWVDGDTPKDDWFIVYICEECDFIWDNGYIGRG